MQRREAVADAVGEGPGAQHAQGHRGGVVECCVDHVVRLLVQVVGVGAAEPERLPVQHEVAVAGGDEALAPTVRFAAPGAAVIRGFCGSRKS